jgi:hypothetical protein
MLPLLRIALPKIKKFCYFQGVLVLGHPEEHPISLFHFAFLLWLMRYSFGAYKGQCLITVRQV